MIQASFRANSRRERKERRQEDAKERKQESKQIDSKPCNVVKKPEERSQKRRENEKKKKIQSCEPCSENSIKHTEEEGGKIGNMGMD